MNRIRSIIDVLPDARNPIDEVLDGGVHIRVERAEDYARRVGERDAIFLEISGKNKPGILVVSGITAEHLVTDISEVQSLFEAVDRSDVGVVEGCENLRHAEPSLGCMVKVTTR